MRVLEERETWTLLTVAGCCLSVDMQGDGTKHFLCLEFIIAAHMFVQVTIMKLKQTRHPQTIIAHCKLL